jgi:hypothetical protein
LSQPSQWAGGEVAALYTCSERAARQELDFAEQVVTHMPLAFEAMLAGRLGRAKVWCSPTTCTICCPNIKTRSARPWSNPPWGGPPANWPTGYAG